MLVPPGYVTGPPGDMQTGGAAHASSSPFYFGCTTVWGTYMTISGLTG